MRLIRAEGLTGKKYVEAKQIKIHVTANVKMTL
jgi:hypothetical protein